MLMINLCHETCAQPCKPEDLRRALCQVRHPPIATRVIHGVPIGEVFARWIGSANKPSLVQSTTKLFATATLGAERATMRADNDSFVWPCTIASRGEAL